MVAVSVDSQQQTLGSKHTHHIVGRGALPGDCGAGLLAGLDQGGPGCIPVSKQTDRRSGSITASAHPQLKPSSHLAAVSNNATDQLAQAAELTNRKLNLRRSLSCRRKGPAGRAGPLLARPPGRAGHCLPQHGAGAVSTGRWRQGNGGEKGGGYLQAVVAAMVRFYPGTARFQLLAKVRGTARPEEQ